MKAIAWIRLFTPQPICRIWWTRSQMNKGNWLGATHVRQTYKVFDLFETLWWRTDTFLHHFFVKEPQNLCSHWHQWFLEWVLNGKGDYWIAHILKAQWGTMDQEDTADAMYLVTVPYTDMRNVQSSLLSFAAQVAKVQLVKEAWVAIQETSELHASVTSKTENRQVKWADIGTSLMATTQSTLQTHQPLTFDYLGWIAEPKSHTRTGEVVTCNYCPA